MSTGEYKPDLATTATIRQNREIAEDHRGRLVGCAFGDIIDNFGKTSPEEITYACSEFFKPSEKIDPLFLFKFAIGGYEFAGDYKREPVENDRAKYAPQLHELILRLSMDPKTDVQISQGQDVIGNVQIGEEVNPNTGKREPVSELRKIPMYPGYVTYAGYHAGTPDADIEITPQDLSQEPDKRALGQRVDIQEHPGYDTGVHNTLLNDEATFNTVLTTCLNKGRVNQTIEHCMTVGVVLRQEHTRVTSLNHERLKAELGIDLPANRIIHDAGTEPSPDITLADIQTALGGSITGGEEVGKQAETTSKPSGFTIADIKDALGNKTAISEAAKVTDAERETSQLSNKLRERTTGTALSTAS